MYRVLLQLLRSSQCCASGAQACQTPAMQEESDREMCIIKSTYTCINLRQLHITMKVSDISMFDHSEITDFSQ